MSAFCFTTHLPCYPEIHPNLVILTPADGNRVPTTLDTNRTNSFRRGAASYWKFICTDATSWEWDPLTVGMVASWDFPVDHLPLSHTSLQGQSLWRSTRGSSSCLCPSVLASCRTICCARGGWMPLCPASSLKPPSENILSSFGSLLGAGVC